jgi:hypothetical protein
MAGIEDRQRQLVVDSVPVVTGLVAVGDAWASTNPSLGRGASIGALRACVLRDVVAKEARPTRTRWCCGSPRRPPRRSPVPGLDPVVRPAPAGRGSRRTSPACRKADDPAWAITRALGAGGREDPVVAAHWPRSRPCRLPGQLLSDPSVLGPVAGYLGRSHYGPGADRAELLAAVRGAERSR